MRSALVIVALACAASAARAEDAQQSRYGPPALRPSLSLSGSTYGGPILSWSGKKDLAASDPGPTHIPAPAPALALRPMATPWKSPGAVAQHPAQASHAPPRQPTAPPAQSPPAPAPAAVAQAQAQKQTPTVPAPRAELSGQTQYARTYSVGRQYGMIPDVIPPAPPNGMIFIASSDEPKPSKKDEEPRHGSVEWLAQAPMDTPDGEDSKRGDK